MTMKGVLLTLVATLPSVAAFLGGKRIMLTMMMNKRKSFIGSYSSRRLLISKWSTMWKNIKLNQRKTKVLTKNKTKQKFTFPFSHRSCLVH